MIIIKKTVPLIFITQIIMSLPMNLLAEEVRDKEEMMFEDIPTVITASLRPQSLLESAVAIDVITEEEIKTSGAINLWDLLRFKVGMDVIEGRSSRGNQAIVSVRGIPSETIRPLQVLIDGRSVYYPVTGLVFWQQLPVQIQDIERIEIVRGPNSALYGSNAGLGVINIMTKKPKAKAALSSRAVGGSLNTLDAGAAVETSIKKLGMRISHTYRSHDGMPRIDSSIQGNDSMVLNKSNLRGYWNLSDRTSLELFMGKVWDTLGVVSSRNPQGRFDFDFQMAKFSGTMGDLSSELTVSRSDMMTVYDPTSRGIDTARSLQYDVGLVQHLKWLEKYDTTWGGSYRYNIGASNQFFSNDPEKLNRIERGFLQQSALLKEIFIITGAVSVENSDTGGNQTAYQGSCVFMPRENHSFRATYSNAPSVPSLEDKFGNRINSSASSTVGNLNFKSEKICSYELGYHGFYLDRALSAETDLYYMTIDDLETSSVTTSGKMRLTTKQNGNAAIARGVEAKLTYHFLRNRSIYANYTFENIADNAGNVLIIAGTPAHKLNLGANAFVSHGICVNINAGYKDSYSLRSNRSFDAYWRLDARLSYQTGSGIEIFVTGQNLLAPTHMEYTDNLAIPRLYFFGLSANFWK